jgi:hypothetical protein
VLIAAKLPADAMIVRAIGGASFLTSRTVSAARPPPMAIRGASGPRTAPKPSVVNAARTMPGSSLSAGAPPPALNPNAGEWPPLPGKYRMVNPVNSPHSTNQGTGHHAGSPPVKIACGRSSNKNSCIAVTSARKPYPTAEIGMPRIAASSSAARYGFERMTATGSIAGAPADRGEVG